MLGAGADDAQAAGSSSSPIKKRRQLGRAISAASAQSSLGGSFSPLGVPDDAPMEAGDEGSGDNFSPMEVEKGCASSSEEDSLAEAAAEVASKPMPQGKNSVKQLVMKRPARATNPVSGSAMGQIKLQLAQKCSYVLSFSLETRKWVLVVESRHRNHQQIMKTIFEVASKGDMVKADCVEMRNKMQLEAAEGDGDSGDDDGSDAEDDDAETGSSDERRGDTSSSSFSCL